MPGSNLAPQEPWQGMRMEEELVPQTEILLHQVVTEIDGADAAFPFAPSWLDVSGEEQAAADRLRMRTALAPGETAASPQLPRLGSPPRPAIGAHLPAVAAVVGTIHSGVGAGNPRALAQCDLAPQLPRPAAPREPGLTRDPWEAADVAQAPTIHQWPRDWASNDVGGREEREVGDAKPRTPRTPATSPSAAASGATSAAAAEPDAEPEHVPSRAASSTGRGSALEPAPAPLLPSLQSPSARAEAPRRGDGLAAPRPSAQPGPGPGAGAADLAAATDAWGSSVFQDLGALTAMLTAAQESEAAQVQAQVSQLGEVARRCGGIFKALTCANSLCVGPCVVGPATLTNSAGIQSASSCAQAAALVASAGPAAEQAAGATVHERSGHKPKPPPLLESETTIGWPQGHAVPPPPSQGPPPQGCPPQRLPRTASPQMMSRVPVTDMTPAVIWQPSGSARQTPRGPPARALTPTRSPTPSQTPRRAREDAVVARLPSLHSPLLR